MGVKNDIFWSEIGPGGTTQPRIPRSNPPPPPLSPGSGPLTLLLVLY